MQNITSRPQTVLCLASYFKGVDFIKSCKAQGCRVLLVTSESLKEDNWPREAIDEYYYMPGPMDAWDENTLLEGVNHMVRTEHVDKIVALDDYDVEKGALLREHLRVPGMGQTRARYFRDKLAMRFMAKEAGIGNPEFIAPFHDEVIADFLGRVPAPWILKPRSQASATGITKLHNADEAWALLNKLGAERVHYVLEQFIPGDVFHVDALAYNGEVIFAKAHRYMSPPMAVAHDGGLFRTHSLETDDPINQDLLRLNEAVCKGFGMKSSAMHTEFLRAHEDGKYYFIETASRVGGAHIAEMVEAASGINLWAEWAKIETLQAGESYSLPSTKDDHAGIIISLARQEHPDMSAYNDEEVVWKMTKPQHAGMIVSSPSQARVIELLDQYAGRFYEDFFASVPIGEKPSS